MAQIAQEDTGKEPPTVQGRESPQSHGSSENIWVAVNDSSLLRHRGTSGFVLYHNMG